MVCTPGALAGAPSGWAAETLRDGELALLVDGGGLDAINAAAHALDLAAVSIVRSEETAAEQAETVQAYAASFPLVWVGAELTDSERTWARERRPMTLLVEVDGPLSDAERGRIERFLSLLARQTE
ncbi:MAG: hypothetical protein QOJ25_2706 [Solirubrobacteraceae bacterium]|jgi:hypothetical protein|nr:hypothetical protein [Solirubrobacteraceae bacterium]